MDERMQNFSKILTLTERSDFLSFSLPFFLPFQLILTNVCFIIIFDNNGLWKSVRKYYNFYHPVILWRKLHCIFIAYSLSCSKANWILDISEPSASKRKFCNYSLENLVYFIHIISVVTCWIKNIFSDRDVHVKDSDLCPS